MSSLDLSRELDEVARQAGITPARYDTSNGNVLLRVTEPKSTSRTPSTETKSSQASSKTGEPKPRASGPDTHTVPSKSVVSESGKPAPEPKSGPDAKPKETKDSTRREGGLPVHSEEEYKLRTEKLAQLEDLLENKLRVDLARAIDARNSIQDSIRVYQELETNLKLIHERNLSVATPLPGAPQSAPVQQRSPEETASTSSDSNSNRTSSVPQATAATTASTQMDVDPLNLQVPLGNGFFVQANIPDPTKVYIAIGLGFFLQMTLPEGIEFAEKRISQLQESCKKVDGTIAQISTRMKFIYEGIRQLMDLPAENVRRRREID